uniref:U59-Sparatoxin-Hju1b_1 n=1 Tax=Heteropoda jugulans TaxID=1358901 RepID=A0A4Q8KCN6_9ARAC
MFGFILMTIASASLVRAQDGDIIAPDNKTQCISQMVEWCNGMQYPQQGVGMTMLSITFEDPTGYYRAFCVSDGEGTNCTRNGMPWFSCSPNHTLTYKGTTLTDNSTEVDDDICLTADRAFNDLFVQNLSYNTTSLETEFEKGMESFFEQIAAMQEEIEQIQKTLMKIPFFDPNFWGGSADSVPDSTTMTPSTISPTTDQNQPN